MQNLSNIIYRGFIGKCPNCAKTRVIFKYISVKEKCDVCNTSFKDLKADDGPAWLTIIIVGHILIPFVIKYSLVDSISEISALIILISFVIALCLLILPRSKGIFIAFLWYIKNCKKDVY